MRVPRLIRFVTWDALFKVPIISFFIKKYQAIPVNLAKFEIASWRKMISALRSGHLLGIFPEGGRTRGDLLDEFKSGFIKVALKETIPIIPVTIKGTREIWHISWVFPRLSGSIEVIFSKPVDISALNANNEDAIELLTRRIREAMLANL
jgi:1-acyl-sn-glycerol-3-phosphate acyltransferase